MKIYDVIVVGAGASGLLAAGRAGELGQNVLLIEKNKRTGEKLRISGGGRCNVTNAEENLRTLLQAYGKAEQSLYSLYTEYGVKDTFDFFESRGVELKVEARKRAFPVTDDASDIVQALERYARMNNVELFTECTVKRVLHKNNEIVGLDCGDQTYYARNFILAVGGMSHPKTGSTGDGFAWLRDLGHNVKEPSPTIVPLKTTEKWAKELAGNTLENTRITFYQEGKKMLRLDGNILFTHFGISGPLILNSASRVSDMLQNGPVSALIDVYPKLDSGALEKIILEVFDANKNKEIKNVLKDLVPAGMQKGIQEIISTTLETSTKVHSFPKADRKVLVNLLKALPLTIEGLMGFDRAVVADGGVSINEIDMRTLRSKIVKNLFVTGDLLNINRPSGGYSLQLCWSTGYVAGTNSAIHNQTTK